MLSTIKGVGICEGYNRPLDHSDEDSHSSVQSTIVSRGRKGSSRNCGESE